MNQIMSSTFNKRKSSENIIKVSKPNNFNKLNDSKKINNKRFIKIPTVKSKLVVTPNEYQQRPNGVVIS